MSKTHDGMARARNAALIALMTAALGACASHPKPMVEPTPVAPAPAAPTPTPPPPPPAVTENQIAPGSIRDFEVNVGDRVYFDYNQYAIRADVAPVLAAQARWLVNYPQVSVRIEGNADERGTREYNFALGARRAEAVKGFLIAHGVEAGRISTISYGKERPIDPGTGEAAWRHNRNAHTAIVGGAR
jgi:peptidoglycan-associated lipoprotein